MKDSQSVQTSRDEIRGEGEEEGDEGGMRESSER